MDKKSAYLKHMLQQYQEATGSKGILDITTNSGIKELADWLYKRNKIGRMYTSYLDYLNIKFAYNDCAEIGKGAYDTVVKKFETSIITPYDVDIEGVDKERVFVAGFEVDNSKPYLLKGSKKISLPPYVFSKLMTQNNSDINKWKSLHDSGNYSIIIGNYGFTSDKDMDKKIEQIEEFTKALSMDNVVYESDTLGDIYFTVVATKNKVKTRIKTKIKTN